VAERVLDVLRLVGAAHDGGLGLLGIQEPGQVFPGSLEEERVWFKKTDHSQS